MKTTRLLLGCVALAALVLDTTQAAADIRWTVSGAVCRAQKQGPIAGASTKGWFVSSEEQGGGTVCPLMRDFTDHQMTSLWVRVQDSPSSSGTPTCAAFSLSTHGVSFDDTAPVDHTNPNGFQSLSINVADLGMASNYAVNVYCDLGDNDTIISLRYVEG